MLAYLIFFSKSLAHLIPCFPNLTGGGSITYLPWIHRDLADESSLKKWLQFSATSDMTQLHISEKCYSETFWQLLCYYLITSPSPLLTFWCCVCLLLAQTTAELLYLLLEGNGREHWGLAAIHQPWALPFHRRLSWGPHYWITLWSMYEPPCCPF